MKPDKNWTPYDMVDKDYNYIVNLENLETIYQIINKGLSPSEQVDVVERFMEACISENKFKIGKHLLKNTQYLKLRSKDQYLTLVAYFYEHKEFINYFEKLFEISISQIIADGEAFGQIKNSLKIPFLQSVKKCNSDKELHLQCDKKLLQLI